jgi:predicted alpha/beta-hydrolase family hydrolase
MRGMSILAAGLVAALGAALWARGEAQAQPAEPEVVEVPTGRGPKLAATLHTPKTPNGAAVVLAPGQGYHRELPLLKQCAEKLADAGFVALRFDWAYFTAKGQPKEDFATEVEDANAAIAFVRARPGVKKVILAGKSLGSLVTVLIASRKDANLAGAGLLTLPVRNPGAPERRPQIAELAKVECPVVILNGDIDPLCDVKELYELSASLGRTPAVVIVPGDHGFATIPNDHPTALPSIDVVSRALVRWAQRCAE